MSIICRSSLLAGDLRISIVIIHSQSQKTPISSMFTFDEQMIFHLFESAHKLQRLQINMILFSFL